MMEGMSALEIVEVGPRDGLQNEDAVLDVAARVAYIEALAAAGLRRIEAVSFVHPARGLEAVLERHGFVRIQRRETLKWSADLYERADAARSRATFTS